jgi:hypothetical protein
MNIKTVGGTPLHRTAIAIAGIGIIISVGLLIAGVIVGADTPSGESLSLTGTVLTTVFVILTVVLTGPILRDQRRRRRR